MGNPVSLTGDPGGGDLSQSATDKAWWSYPAAPDTVGYAANSLNQYSAVGSVTPTGACPRAWPEGARIRRLR